MLLMSGMNKSNMFLFTCRISVDGCIFFFNDSATTGIYTDGHTLSLHDALPIYPGAPAQIHESHPALGSNVGNGDRRAFRALLFRMRLGSSHFTILFQADLCCMPSWEWGSRSFSRIRVRSEEHTSELQSLMRISYAVFCLKKTIHTISYSTLTSKKTHI